MDTLRVRWGKRQPNGTGTAPVRVGRRGRTFRSHTCSAGESWGASAELALTFSLETLWEKGQVPSVFLHVPRRNLRARRSGFEGLLRRGRGPCTQPTLVLPGPQGRSPGAHGHLLGVVDVGAALPAVASAEAVVVHAELWLLPPPPLPGLPHQGQAALERPAADTRGRWR